MTWQVGQKWKNRVGKVFVIKRIDMSAPYPIYAVEYKSKNDTEWLYSLNGAFTIDGKAGDNMDLVELVEDSEMKKTMKELYEEIREEEKLKEAALKE